MQSIKITIIIPFYKLRYFSKTLESLSQQSNMFFNVLIGNDNSPEEVGVLLGSFKENLKITYIKFEDNLGAKDLTMHWKRCIDLIDTEWFMILGDDDQLSHDAIAEFYRVIENPLNTDYHVLRFRREIIDGSGNIVVEKTVYPDNESSVDFLYKRSLNEVGSSLGEYVFKTDDYKKYGIRNYTKAFYSDNMMVLEYSGFKTVKNIENASAKIRISPESLSGDSANKGSIKKAGWEFYLDIIREYGHHFDKKQLSHFLNILLGGVMAPNPIMSKWEFVSLNLKTTGVWDSLRKMVTLIKNL